LGGNPYRDGSYEYYMSEKVVVNDPKGVGAFLKAGNEMEMLPTLKQGKGKTVMLDCFFNHELKKDVTGTTVQHHYVWDQMDLNGYSLFGFVWNKHGAKTKDLADCTNRKKSKRL
jgi:unsaturated rhamnogalacturonyl hydrolase